MQWITSVPEKRVSKVSPVSIIVASLLILMILALWAKGWLNKPDVAPPPPEALAPNYVSTISPSPLPPLASPTPSAPATAVPLDNQAGSKGSETVTGNIPETGPAEVAIVLFGGMVISYLLYHRVRQQNELHNAWRAITVLN